VLQYGGATLAGRSGQGQYDQVAGSGGTCTSGKRVIVGQLAGADGLVGPECQM
jgi:hypothetical protein